jgi:tetratricopeptide (TPR) repeat protein
MSESSPRVSVIIRSMGRPSLAAALDSIALQDYPDVEVVLVNALGADHPPPPATAGAHPVRFIPGEARRSRPEAANAGLDGATGEWITFLDDDDAFLAGHLSGLVEAQSNAPDVRFVYTLTRMHLADGSVQPFGQPFSLMQLYERNFIHLSAALFARSLVAEGCRFNGEFEIMQDWDFFLQCAQKTRFHFEPRQTFQWNADAGSSGAGGSLNQNDERFARFRDQLYAKWAPQHDALVDRVTPILDDATTRARGGDLTGAEARVRDLLSESANDPWALNLLAMIQRSTGRLEEADVTQSLAVSVRPQDPTFTYNLGLLCRARGDMPRARRCAERALRLAPDYAPAQKLLAELGG